TAICSRRTTERSRMRRPAPPRLCATRSGREIPRATTRSPACGRVRSPARTRFTLKDRVNRSHSATSRGTEVSLPRVRWSRRGGVVAGATSNDTRAAAEEAKRMAEAGADYILSATPYYNKPTMEGLFRHFGAVADAAGKPVILYNVPGRTSVNMDAATTLGL